MYVLYYASLLRYWHLVWILFRTDYHFLGVGWHTKELLDLQRRWILSIQVKLWSYTLKHLVHPISTHPVIRRLFCSTVVYFSPWNTHVS
jgi:hypothetical protein